MRSTVTKVAVMVALGLLVLAVLHAVAQPGPGGPPFGGPPGGPPGIMGPMPPPPMPTPVVVVADGVVYVACAGKITAFEARTLKKLGEATYWEPPAPPKQPKEKPQE